MTSRPAPLHRALCILLLLSTFFMGCSGVARRDLASGAAMQTVSAEGASEKVGAAEDVGKVVLVVLLCVTVIGLVVLLDNNSSSSRDRDDGCDGSHHHHRDRHVVVIHDDPYCYDH